MKERSGDAGAGVVAGVEVAEGKTSSRKMANLHPAPPSPRQWPRRPVTLPPQDPLPPTCYIDRTPKIDQWEADLEYLTAFVQIIGTRPPVTPEDALQAIVNQFNLDASTLEIHRVTSPEDFLLRVPNHDVPLAVLQGDRTVNTPAF